MKKTIEFQGRKVHYSIDGDGDALLFIHGYLESSEIWNGFTDRFIQSHRVISLDIPGHGDSEVLGDIHEMWKMADIAASVVKTEGIDRITVIGHSMGGYITMEFVNRFAEMMNGYCLFHSTCFADNEEKKSNRDREISLVKCGKKRQIINTNIPKAFGDSSLNKFRDKVEKAKEIALRSPDDGIIALIRGMKERKDYSELLSESIPAPLLIFGEKDNYISKEVLQKLIVLAPQSSVIVLKESGHMGFIEEPDLAYAGIMDYLEKIK